MKRTIITVVATLLIGISANAQGFLIDQTGYYPGTYQLTPEQQRQLEEAKRKRQEMERNSSAYNPNRLSIEDTGVMREDGTLDQSGMYYGDGTTTTTTPSNSSSSTHRGYSKNQINRQLDREAKAYERHKTSPSAYSGIRLQQERNKTRHMTGRR